jgi:O-methyltransferase
MNGESNALRASDDGEMQRQLAASDQLFADITGFVVFNQVEGDYLEFGVYRGDSLVRVNHWLNVHWAEFTAIASDHGVPVPYDNAFLHKKRFIAFDSFQGLPGSTDPHTPVHFAKGTYRAAQDVFLENVTRQGVDRASIVAVPGWFHETLVRETKETLGLNKAAIIFVDCDLAESAALVFEFATGLIQDGTAIIMDDYFRYKGHPRKGVQGAFNEWRSRHPWIHTAELTRCSANRVAFVCNLMEHDPGERHESQ